MYKQFYISFKIILNKGFLVFKTQGYIVMNYFSVNGQICKKPDIRMKVRMKSYVESYGRTTRDFSGQDRFLGIEA